MIEQVKKTNPKKLKKLAKKQPFLSVRAYQPPLKSSDFKEKVGRDGGFHEHGGHVGRIG